MSHGIYRCPICLIENSVRTNFGVCMMVKCKECRNFFEVRFDSPTSTPLQSLPPEFLAKESHKDEPRRSNALMLQAHFRAELQIELPWDKAYAYVNEIYETMKSTKCLRIDFRTPEGDVHAGLLANGALRFSQPLSYKQKPKAMGLGVLTVMAEVEGLKLPSCVPDAKGMFGQLAAVTPGLGPECEEHQEPAVFEWTSDRRVCVYPVAKGDPPLANPTGALMFRRLCRSLYTGRPHYVETNIEEYAEHKRRWKR
jgi:hypothetical protein